MWWLDRTPPVVQEGRRESSQAALAVMESRSGQAGRADLITSFPHPGVPPTMLGVYTLLLLWGLATPCLGLLETVGTLARIDKDELGKGEPEACGLAATVRIRDRCSSQGYQDSVTNSGVCCEDPGRASNTHLGSVGLLSSSSSGH